MTEVLPELGGLPTGLVLDGELVAWKGREPYFPLVCRRVLNRDMSVLLTNVGFDVLSRDGDDLTSKAVRRTTSCPPGPTTRRAALDDL